MSSRNPSNKGASIRQKLLNYARAHEQDFQRTIDTYAIECILDRMARSAYCDRFLLKGALLFAVWKGIGERPTRDIDLLGRGLTSLDSVVQIMKEIVSIEVDYDGVVFFPEQTEGRHIKEDDEYEGFRVFVSGALSGAVFKVHIDVGLGEVVTPCPVSAVFPRMLEMSRFSLLMYPPETVFAEKLEGIVTRGMLNSRMKDYYDLSVLIHDAMLKQASTKTAISRTFGRRKTHPSSSCPSGLSDEFEEDTTKNRQWNAFLRKHSFVAPTLSEVVRSSRVYVRVQPPPIGKKGLFDEF